ncbi:unnamed protein product [Brassica napus]|uniref:(rape) hypothetical protein n=1 Tax=Brassica napus TaxID=3708 RepID=A0A816S8G2_BRANA|nr:unnamed protein product [Brassica napus]
MYLNYCRDSLSKSPAVKPYLQISVSFSSRWSLKLRLRSPRGSYSGLNAPSQPLASSSRLSSLSGASGFAGSSPSNQTEIKAELIRANIFVVCCDSLGFVSSTSSSSGAPECVPDAPSMPAWSHLGECSIELAFRLFSCFLISSPEQEALRIGSLACCLLSFNVY